MRLIFRWFGRFAGVMGVGLIGLAVAGRLVGIYWIRGFQIGTILEAGMACVLLGCLGYLAALAEGSNPWR